MKGHTATALDVPIRNLQPRYILFELDIAVEKTALSILNFEMDRLLAARIHGVEVDFRMAYIRDWVFGTWVKYLNKRFLNRCPADQT